MKHANGEIAKKVVSELLCRKSKLIKDSPTGASDSRWTEEVVKPALVKAGNCLGYYTCANKVQSVEVLPAYSSEWLYDICWIDYGPRVQNHSIFEVAFEKRKFYGLVLAAESEWGNDDQVLNDFEKLLQCRAALKIMIFDQTAAPRSWDRLAGIMSDWAKNSGDQFLLVGYIGADREFEIKSIPQLPGIDTRL